MTDRIHNMTEQGNTTNEKEIAAAEVKEAFMLPKNIRQMGQPGHRHKFYIEDYVYTYLHMFLKEKHQEDTLQAAVLLGRQEIHEECCYTFICGAAACDFSVFYEGGEAQIQESIQRHFPGRQIAGWYVRCIGQDAHVQSVIKHYYAEHGETLSLSFIYEDDLDDAFDVYVWEQNALRPLEGFYIYYERNPQMQEFLIREKGGQASESPATGVLDEENRNMESLETEDTQTEFVRDSQIRGVQEQFYMEPEREPAAELLARDSLPKRQKKSHRVLYAACAVVLLVAVATGVTQMGDYQNLKNFPQTIQTMSDGILRRKESAGNENSQEEVLSWKGETIPMAEGENSEQSKAEQSSAGEKRPVDETENREGAHPETIDGEDSDSKDEESNVGENRHSKTDEKNGAGADKGSEPQEGERQQAGAVQQGYYTVKKGDSLLSISRALYKTDVMVEAICAENGISNVDVIYEGQKLRLP